MAKRAGVSGLAVAMAAGGGFLVYSGIRNVPILEGLRDVAKGRLPAPRPVAATKISFSPAAAAVGAAAGDALGAAGDGLAGGIVGSAIGSRVELAARKYIGVRYRFGGHDPSGFDCSGLVTYVLHHDLGINLAAWSAGANNLHTVTGQFLVTDGLVTVPRSQARSGDLVCWPGHIGIAVSADRMINAPHAGANVREDSIWGQPLFRRIKGM